VTKNRHLSRSIVFTAELLRFIYKRWNIYQGSIQKKFEFRKNNSGNPFNVILLNFHYI